MASATHNFSKTILLTALGMITCWSLNSVAQGKAAKNELPKKVAPAAQAEAAPVSDKAPVLKFNTDSALVNTDTRNPLTFKDGSNGTVTLPPKPSEMDNSIPEDAPFKTYIGYPKYFVGANFNQNNVSAKWTRGAQDLNYNSGATGYGIVGRIQATPKVSSEIEYNHVSGLKVDAGGVTGAIINASETDLDTYMIKTKYCYISNSGFQNQYCPGFDIGSDAYPILEYASSTNLELGKTTDIVLGLNFTYQRQFSDKLIGKAGVGFNMGTGMGNQGYLTSKTNTSYYLKLAPEWNIKGSHHVVGNFEYKVRTAKVSGKVSPTVEDSWDIESSTMLFGLGYMYAF